MLHKCTYYMRIIRIDLIEFSVGWKGYMYTCTCTYKCETEEV